MVNCYESNKKRYVILSWYLLIQYTQMFLKLYSFHFPAPRLISFLELKRKHALEKWGTHTFTPFLARLANRQDCEFQVKLSVELSNCSYEFTSCSELLSNFIPSLSLVWVDERGGVIGQRNEVEKFGEWRRSVVRVCGLPVWRGGALASGHSSFSPFKFMVVMFVSSSHITSL